MIYTNFVGRIGKDARVTNSQYGEFITIDVATDNYNKGQETTTWVRVKSNLENHVKLSQYLTKGKMILVEGELKEPEVFQTKDGTWKAGLTVKADIIRFISMGRRKDNDQNEEQPAVVAAPAMGAPVYTPPTDLPFERPDENKDGLPF